MSGYFTWWANRKSRIGISPAARKPPHPPGKHWWTDPPVAPPQPEHIEYVVQYMRELEGRAGKQRNVLLGHCSDWLHAARQLLHEQIESQRGDLHTTDGLIIAADRAMQNLIGKCCKAKLLSPDELRDFEEIKQALGARASHARRGRTATGRMR